MAVHCSYRSCRSLSLEALCDFQYQRSVCIKLWVLESATLLFLCKITMGTIFTLALVALLSKFDRIVCLKCYACNLYDKPNQYRNSWSQSCNVLYPGKQWANCPKLAQHCFTICTVDTIRKLRYTRRGESRLF